MSQSEFEPVEIEPDEEPTPEEYEPEEPAVSPDTGTAYDDETGEPEATPRDTAVEDEDADEE